ncbi:MAG: ribosome small subunit-dependent GTPase A [Oscillospiraceae bacterium]|nr:ribosome small subunit-dependent GTPase A [Oscillospiraceae bacterium]
MRGRIIKGVKDFFDVYVEEDNEYNNKYKNKVISCNSRGVFRKDSVKLKPFVGDIVEIEINHNQKDEAENWGIIKKIEERKNLLQRPPVANLDILFIVSSVKSPSPSYFFIDKLTATAVENDITPVIIINKIDLKTDDELYNIYSKTGFKTIKTSAVSENSAGIDEIKNEMRDKICAFAGVSGAGKSSILNNIFKDLNLDTGSLSNKINRGKHTTRTVEFFKNNIGGYAADTPGFSMLDFENENYMLKENLVFAFPDLLKYAENCKYTKCTHIKEEGCKIIEALNNGEISKSRHESYIAIYEMLKNHKFVKSKDKSEE